MKRHSCAANVRYAVNARIQFVAVYSNATLRLSSLNEARKKPKAQPAAIAVNGANMSWRVVLLTPPTTTDASMRGGVVWLGSKYKAG